MCVGRVGWGGESSTSTPHFIAVRLVVVAVRLFLLCSFVLFFFFLLFFPSGLYSFEDELRLNIFDAKGARKSILRPPHDTPLSQDLRCHSSKTGVRLSGVFQTLWQEHL